MIRKHYHSQALAAIIAMPLLFGTSASAFAGQCSGYKIVQSCTTPTTPGTPNYGSCLAQNGSDIASPSYQACVAFTPPITGPTICKPVKVPCNYPDNIFDAISSLFSSQR